MKKKVLMILFCGVLVFGITGCGKTMKEDNNTNQNNKEYKYYKNGEVIYFNPETNQKCSKEDAVSQNGTKTGCMKWYSFNDKSNSSTINLLLDHNTTPLVAYNSEDGKEMKEVKDALEQDTSTWHNSIKKSARLISVDDIVDIINIKNFDVVNHSMYAIATSSQKEYSWLMDNTIECREFGCDNEDNNMYEYTDGKKMKIRGYWTSTCSNDEFNNVWVISHTTLSKLTPHEESLVGVRPVITISKDVLK